MFAGIGVILSVFNLLPVKPMDGWRMLFAVFPKASYIISDIASFVLLCVGVYIMMEGYGTALACMGIFFLVWDSGDTFVGR